MGEAEAKKILQPLLNHLEGKQPGIDSDPEGKRFKEFATGIAAFMQAGKYHTAGEVIGGLYIASRALLKDPKDNINIDGTFKEFRTLMRQFGENPENFLDVSSSDKEKIQQCKEAFSSHLVTAQQIRGMQRAIQVKGRGF